jgi:hypothetical protein
LVRADVLRICSSANAGGRMSLNLLTDAAAVHAAMDEYDRLGGDAFL